MNRTEAFAKYGAKLKNCVWSVAAKNNRGELVLSLWKQYFKPGDGVITYIDKASRWKGPGNNEFRLYLDSAFKNGQIIRAVIPAMRKPLQAELTPILWITRST